MSNLVSITVYSSTDSMGDTTAENANKYRDWLKSELLQEYGQEVEVDVIDADNTRAIVCKFDGNDFEDEQKIDEINDYCRTAWDRCAWEWA